MPGDDLKELSDWKDELSGRAEEKVEELSFDLVVVGGGMSGCGAALRHASGIKGRTDSGSPLFGGNASQEIRVHTLGIHGYGSDILKSIDTFHYPNGDHKAKIDQVKRKNNGRIRR